MEIEGENRDFRADTAKYDDADGGTAVFDDDESLIAVPAMRPKTLCGIASPFSARQIPHRQKRRCSTPKSTSPSINPIEQLVEIMRPIEREATRLCADEIVQFVNPTKNRHRNNRKNAELMKPLLSFTRRLPI